jgi:7-cyano-7-deazaguanine synthase in queuosine biosynthesis
MSDLSDRDGSIPENKEVVVVWSGGLDSTSLIAMMIKDYTCGVYPLFINRGQGNYRFEKIAIDHYNDIFLQQFGLYHQYCEIEVPIPPNQFKKGLPKRYTHVMQISDIINQAVRYALTLDADTILIGTIPSDRRGNSNNVTLKYFVSKTNEVRLGTDKPSLHVLAPFLLLHYNKREIIAWSSSNGLDLSKTRSCVGNRPEPCGECDACKSRSEAFNQQFYNLNRSHGKTRTVEA